MKALITFVSFFVLILFANLIQSQPGSLDESFGTGGIVTAPLTTHGEYGYTGTIQADGKILVAGFQDVSGSQNFAVARYNTNGSLDNSFGTGGLTLFDAGTDADAAWTMALQDDGKIILGGSVNNQFTTFDDYALVRLNSDGTPDNTFGTGGLVMTDIDGHWDNAYDMVLQDDGKILLAGQGYTNSNRKVCVVRYNTDGTLDASFGAGGIAINVIGCGVEKTRAIALQADGKIIVAGYFNEGTDDQAFVTRFNSDGTVDNTFGNNGTATLDIAGNKDRFWTLYVLPDGKILAGGTTDPADDPDYLLVKYLSDGTLDNSFGSNGMSLNNFGVNDLLLDMIVDADGKILTAGGGFSFELVRFLDTGYPDTDFGTNGIVNTSIGNFCFAYSVCLQADGRIVVSGHSNNGNDYDLTVARYHAAEGSYVDEQSAIIHHVNVYPNPISGGQITLEYVIDNTEVLSAEILSVSGKKIDVLINNQLRAAGHHEEDLRMPVNLAAGIYFIRLFTEKENIYHKIVIP
ncbi:MAG: hypothetical protein DRI97_13060 [Bacteroidetes bacterium]|nr:MAG: hypothetical protein DRI97_13060 [Bacteroidota bacterium]